MNGRNALAIGALILWGVPALAQQPPAEGQSCAGRMTDQLRRFNEQCLSDLVAYVAAQQKATAKVLGEKSKFYVQITRTAGGLDGEAVSRANYPLMSPETAEALKALGWAPPDNEEGTFRTRFAADAPAARTAEDLAKTLAAYGLGRGEAIAVTIGTPD